MQIRDVQDTQWADLASQRRNHQTAQSVRAPLIAGGIGEAQCACRTESGGRASGGPSKRARGEPSRTRHQTSVAQVSPIAAVLHAAPRRVARVINHGKADDRILEGPGATERLGPV